MNKIEKINFHDNEIVAVKKKGQKYVAMKPIVEAMGLDWSKQLRMIKNDPVLSSVVDETSITGSDGKVYKMVCLPLSKLNGWLFKIDANRYRHDTVRFSAIVTYQNNCYDALYDYFHKGVAVNPAMTDSQLKSLVSTLEQEIYRRIEAENRLGIIERQMEKLAEMVIPKRQFGEISEVTGLPMDIVIPAHIRSRKQKHKPQVGKYIQLLLPFHVVRELFQSTYPMIGDLENA